jgi:hypothetical protein
LLIDRKNELEISGWYVSVAASIKESQLHFKYQFLLLELQ